MLTQNASPSSVAQPVSTIKTVLLATDGSSYAETALQNAIHLLQHNGGRLVITYFADPNDNALFDGFPCCNEAEWQAYGKNVLERLASKAREAGIEVETVLENYQGEICLSEMAAKVGADLIVLGSHLFKLA